MVYNGEGVGGNSGSWGLQVSVFWEGRPVGAQLTLVHFSMFISKNNLNQLMHSFSKRSIHLLVRPNKYYLSTCTRKLAYHHCNSCTAQLLVVVQKMDYVIYWIE